MSNPYSEYTDKLFEGILKLESVEECYEFFGDLCTVNELISMTQRFEVACKLKEGKTFAEISSESGASTTTISRVNRCLSYGAGGYDIVLGKPEKKQ